MRSYVDLTETQHSATHKGQVCMTTQYMHLALQVKHLRINRLRGWKACDRSSNLGVGHVLLHIPIQQH